MDNPPSCAFPGLVSGSEGLFACLRVGQTVEKGRPMQTSQSVADQSNTAATSILERMLAKPVLQPTGLGDPEVDEDTANEGAADQFRLGEVRVPKPAVTKFAVLELRLAET